MTDRPKYRIVAAQGGRVRVLGTGSFTAATIERKLSAALSAGADRVQVQTLQTRRFTGKARQVWDDNSQPCYRRAWTIAGEWGAGKALTPDAVRAALDADARDRALGQLSLWDGAMSTPASESKEQSYPPPSSSRTGF